MEIIISNLSQDSSKEELQNHINKHFGRSVFSLVEQHRDNGIHMYGLVTIKHDEDADKFIASINNTEFCGKPLNVRPYMLRSTSNDKRVHGSDELLWFGHEKRVRERRALIRNIIRHQG